MPLSDTILDKEILKQVIEKRLEPGKRRELVTMNLMRFRISLRRALDDFIDFHGKPKRLRIDNGPVYTSHHMQLWAKERKIELQFIQPGKPTQNRHIERFNRTYRTEVLDAYLCMQEIRAVTEAFQHKYNDFRPHGSLNDMAPVEFKEYGKSFTGRNPNEEFKAVTSKGENP